MKRWVIMAIAVISVCNIYFGCDDHGPGEPNYFVEIDDIWIEGDCCSDSRTRIFLEIHGSAPNFEHKTTYFHARIIDFELTMRREGPARNFDGNFYGETLYVDVDYFDALPSGKYYLKVFGQTMQSGSKGKLARDDEETIILRDQEIIQVDSLGTAQCSDCCTGLYYYCGFAKRKTDLSGVSADIEMRYPRHLCGYPNSDSTTHSVIYINILRLVANDSIFGHYWGQMGCGLERSYGLTSEMRHLYFEAYGGDGDSVQRKRIWGSEAIPAESEINNFKCILDTDLGQWHYFLNGEELFPGLIQPSAGWVGKFGTQVSWVAELAHMENDMVGIFEDSCNITNCSFRQALGTFEISQNETDSDYVFSDDWGQWAVKRVNGHSISIWDKFVLNDK